MKILFIAPLPPPITGHSLAAKVFLEHLTKYHEVEMVNFNKHGFKQGINSFIRIFEIFGVFKDIWQKRKNADVIYFTISQSLTGNIKDFFIYLICYKKLPKMIIHLHGGAGMRNIMSKKNSVMYFINKFFFRKLAGVIILGESHIDIFSQFLPKEKIHIVPNFAQDYLFIKEEDIRNKFNNIEPLKFIFLSNLISGKGFNELIEAFLTLDDKQKKQIKIDFAGGFESASQKIKFLKKIDGIAGIQYHGVVSGAKKKNLLSQAHVFCLPTYYSYEGQPISILEAYATGCVVITTNHSGIQDIFKNNINGFEVQKKLSLSIKEIMMTIIEKSEKLLPIAILNRITANDKYRTSFYNASLLRIIESLDSKSNGQ